MKNNSYYRSILLIILAAIPVFAIIYVTDTNELYNSLSKFDAFSIASLTAFSLLMYFLRYIRWTIICKHNDIHLTHKENLAIYFSGFIMAFTPARSGEIVRAYFIPKTESRLKFAAHSFLVERVGDLSAITFFGLIAILFAQPETLEKLTIFETQTTVAILAIIVIVLTVMFQITSRYKKFNEKFDKIKSATSNISLAYAWKTFIMSLIIWALQLYIITLITDLSLISVTTSATILVYTASLIVGTASMIPGGLGGFDVTFMMLMSLLEQPTENALLSLVTIRIFGLWLGVLLGIPAWYFTARSNINKKNCHN